MKARLGILPALLLTGAAGLCCLSGCQSGNATASKESIVPSFGKDIVPRQSEPDIDGVAVKRATPLPDSAETPVAEDDFDLDDGKAPQGNLLTRLIPGRDKGKDDAKRKAIPVSERTAAADDLDGFDF